MVKGWVIQIRDFVILGFLAKFLFFFRIKTKSKTLAIIKLDAIGDYVLWGNFIEVIKNDKNYADYKITLCANPSYQDLAVMLDGEFIYEFIWIDKDRLRRSVA